jgi:2,3,4,5-tetrahydropyridine-2-carboxylate N-succinyltransferase
MNGLDQAIDDLWDARTQLVPGDPLSLSPVRMAMHHLNTGRLRVAEIDTNNEVIVHEWLRRAILLYFKLSLIEVVSCPPFEFADKVPLKDSFERFGVRAVPGAVARYGSYLERGVVLMPSFVNVGARVGANTMVDTWATVGSCAQVGANVHLSGGVGIGGVLEPPQAKPVIIEDDVFIGSRSMIVEGARVRRGAKLGAGVLLSPSIPVIDAETGQEVSRGDVPERAVAVMANRTKSFAGGEFGLPCVLILRYLGEGEIHDKLVLESILREHGVAV